MELGRVCVCVCGTVCVCVCGPSPCGRRLHKHLQDRVRLHSTLLDKTIIGEVSPSVVQALVNGREADAGPLVPLTTPDKGGSVRRVYHTVVEALGGEKGRGEGA